MKKVITYGTFDTLHEGHINILRRAKALGDYLVVGLSTEKFNEIKGKKTYQKYKDRKEVLEGIKYVDKVIPEKNRGQKEDDIKENNIDIFVMGDDRKGKFDELNKYCEVKYLPRTKGISSTKIRNNIFKMFLDKKSIKIIEKTHMFKKISIKISSALFIPLFYILSYVIKKRKGLYIFGSMNGNNVSGNSKAMFEFYKDKKGITTYYMTRNKSIVQNSIIYINSFKAIKLILKAEYIFTDSSASSVSPSLALLGKFKIIRLWHGDAIKKINFDSKKYISSIGRFGRFLLKNEYKNNVIIPVGSKANEKIMNSSFLGNKAKVTGLPRNDIFFQNNKNEILKKAGELEKYKKIIAYTPTWRDSSSTIKPFSKEVLSKINKYLKENNYILLISGHIQTEEVKFTEMSNIKNFKNPNIETQELLLIADILISDYSSIYIDFLLTNKPIIFYAYDINEYLNKDRELYFNYEDVVINETLVKNENDLFDTIKNIDNISNDYNYLNSYKKIKDFFHENQNGGYCNNLDSYINKK